MKYLIILLTIGLASCNVPDQKSTYVPAHKESFTVNQGLHKITIDDTVHVLIYKGVESVTMIQIK